MDIGFSAASMFVGIVFGAIGLGLFLYGKRQGQLLHLVTGITLMVYPYFVPDALWMTVVGVGIVGALVAATKIL